MAKNTFQTQFGLIFHWGLYSVPAYDDPKSARRRKTQNGSEWYLSRLNEKSEYRPISGYKQTQEYHEKNYQNVQYSDFTKLFTAKNYNPDEWMKLAVSVGAKYVILTAKHHDGFCLWKTSTTEYNSYKTIKRDLLDEFIKAGKKYGLCVGIYFSWIEFGKSATKDFFNTIVVPQVKELMKYNPDIFWFDGHWGVKTKFANNKVSELISEIKKHNKKIRINDRLYGSSELKELYESKDFLGDSTFRVFSDRFIPNKKLKVPWEHINTIGISWGCNKAQEDKDYKSYERLYELYSTVKKFGGNFLLNLGPDAEGNLDQNEVYMLKGFGELLKEGE